MNAHLPVVRPLFCYARRGAIPMHQKEKKDKKHKKAKREEPRVKEEEINREVEEHVVAQPTEQRRPFFDEVVPQFAIWGSLGSHGLS